MSNEDPALKPALANQAGLHQHAQANPVGAEGHFHREMTIDPEVFHRGGLNAGKDGVPDYTCWDDKQYCRDMHKKTGGKILVNRPATRPFSSCSHVSDDRWPFKKTG